MSTILAPPVVDAGDLPSWDLSTLYRGIDDPRIVADMKEQIGAARRFAETYRGRIQGSDLTADRLLGSLRAYEEILRRSHRPRIYAGLVYAADSGDCRNGALVQRLSELGTEVRNQLVFFELELCALPEGEFQRAIDDERLEEYRHFLETQRAFAPYRLSEPEEKILEEKANTGARAFRRLFDETVANMTFRVSVAGETCELPEAKVLALLYDPHRETRRAAAEGLTEGLRGQSRSLGLTFNSLLLDKAVNDRLRGFPAPETARHLHDELTGEIVGAVVEAVVEGYPVVADYYRLKAKLLGISPLTHYDRYAPIGEAATQIPYARARAMVLDAFASFAPEAHDAAEGFFRENRIDAALRPGKQGGAFCASVDSERSPFVLMNYTEQPRDVMTLAHELGHGIHGVMSQRQRYLNYRSVLPLAETASVFGEMLVFERLMEQLPNDPERLALLCEKIEDTFGTSFRQVALYRFEQAAHRRRREDGELSVPVLNEIWQQSVQEMYGSSVELGEDHAWWWLYIPHFIHTPFYVYAYAVGELLVLSLYARYRREGTAFVPRFLELLVAGGSRTPRELLADLGIDLTSQAFWVGGIELIRGYVRQAWELADRVGTAA